MFTLSCLISVCTAMLYIVYNPGHLSMCFISDEWSMEDKILFEQAYSSHGKSFKRIQQIVSVSFTPFHWKSE